MFFRSFLFIFFLYIFLNSLHFLLKICANFKNNKDTNFEYMRQVLEIPIKDLSIKRRLECRVRMISDALEHCFINLFIVERNTRCTCRRYTVDKIL